MNTSLILVLAAILIAGCEPPPAAKPQAAAKPAAKPVKLAKNVFFEKQPSGQRRVLIEGEVCFREGQLEMFMCKKFTKEHESIVTADIDCRDVHKALLAAGAVAVSPVKFEPKYEPAKGTTIRVFVRYTKDGKEVTANAREWVRDSKTREELATDWVFGGSFFFADPDDDEKAPKKPKLYAANSGDVICVSNFPSAMLDLPIQSSDAADELMFEAFTERIPPLGTKVTVILEPQVEKKDAKAAEKK